MNARRVAALHLELARVHAELAEAIEADGTEPPCPECAERDLDQVDAALAAREALARFALDWRGPAQDEPRAVIPRRSRAREGVQVADAIVYFIGVKGGGPIKIGFTTTLESRCATLRVGSPVELELLATEHGGFEVEQALHDRFRLFRMHGEWFRPEAELLAHIDSLRLR